MSLLTDFIRLRHRPTAHEAMRAGESLIADAKSDAKDKEIARATAELADVREMGRRKRVEVALATRLARDVCHAVENAGESFEVGIDSVARKLMGGD